MNSEYPTNQNIEKLNKISLETIDYGNYFDKEFKNKYNIITCEKCFRIPKIVFLNKNKVKIDCYKCKSSEIKDINYFEKFKKNSNEKNLDNMPICTYDKSHKSKSIKYCIKIY